MASMIATSPTRRIDLESLHLVVSASNKTYLDYKLNSGDGGGGTVPKWPWLTTLEVQIKAQATTVGNAIVQIICPYDILLDFHSVMDDHSQEVYELSKIFDHTGSLCPEIALGTRGEWGSGVFGEEMDLRPMAYLDEVRINPEHQSQGIGTKVMPMLMELIDNRVRAICYAGPNFLYCRPMFVEGAVDYGGQEQLRAQSGRIVSFFQKVGFRRIGRTDFFAYAMYPEHPSRTLPISSDAPGIPDIDQDTSSPEYATRFPVHHAIVETLRPLRQASDAVDTIEARIRASILDLHWSNPDSLRQADAYGNTPLHLAAQFAKPTVVAVLLSIEGPRESSDLWKENVLGQTPLQAVEKQIRTGEHTRRTFGVGWHKEAAELEETRRLLKAVVSLAS